jgi:hypothetical protein
MSLDRRRPLDELKAVALREVAALNESLKLDALVSADDHGADRVLAVDGHIDLGTHGVEVFYQYRVLGAEGQGYGISRLSVARFAEDFSVLFYANDYLIFMHEGCLSSARSKRSCLGSVGILNTLSV